MGSVKIVISVVRMCPCEVQKTNSFFRSSTESRFLFGYANGNALVKSYSLTRKACVSEKRYFIGAKQVLLVCLRINKSACDSCL